MKKKFGILLAAFLVAALCLCVSHAQVAEKGAKNTITLPNGDVIWDLRGQWDALYVGPLGSFKDIVSITQQNSYFVGTKIIGTPLLPKDYVSIKGELDKDGIKKARLVLNVHGREIDCKGQISEDGDKIVIDGEFELGLIRATFIKQ